MAVKVSIVIPVYNVEEFVEECIVSVMNQTYTNLEIILVDDGSTDSSGKKCDEVSLQDDRIIVIHKENGGLSSARNTGLKCAKGEFVYFIDSDDMLDKTAIEKLVAIAVSYNLDAIFFGAKVVDEYGVEVSSNRYCRIGDYSQIKRGCEMFGEMIRNKEHYSSVPLIFFRKNSITIEFSHILHEDELFTVEYLYRADRVMCLNELLYIRRNRRESITTKRKTINHFSGMYQVIEGLLNISNKDCWVVRYCCTLLQCLEMIYIELPHKDKKVAGIWLKKMKRTFRDQEYYGSKRLKITSSFLCIYPIYAFVKKILKPNFQ